MIFLKYSAFCSRSLKSQSVNFYTSPLISLTEKGLFCEAGGFYIDPHRAVEVAVVTHAHSDHARRGSKLYYSEKSGVGLVKARLGKNINIKGVEYGESFTLGKVKVSLHPAGHILGSAQVRVEYEGEVWVSSGDYKRDSDPSCVPFQTVTCDTFITEATFGTPKYQWSKSIDHGESIASWWNQNADAGRNAILFGYSLGKAQRILAELAVYANRPIIIHPSMVELTECYRKEGINIAPTRSLDEAIDECRTRERSLSGELILAPPSIENESFKEFLGEYETAFASGWMQNGSGYGETRYSKGFVMSDHADWNDLHQTIKESGAKNVFVQHRSGALIRSLRKLGINAHPEEALKKENYARLGGQELSFW